MRKSVFVSHLLKTSLESFVKCPSIETATNLKQEIEKTDQDESLQNIQDAFISRLLLVLDTLKNQNETKTIVIKCMNLIFSRSTIQKELPYKTILCIMLKQIYDFPSNSYNKQLSEELKLEIFRCLEVTSRNLDKDVVQEIMIDQHKVLLGQCIFICKEAIVKETYLKLRQSAVEALHSVMQLHTDINDIVLREQISKVLFIVLPQVATVLTKVCQEETLRGSHLIEASLKTLGMFLCLILEDYERKSDYGQARNDDFRRLVKQSDNITHEKKSNDKRDISKLEKNDEWMKNTSEKLSKLIPNLKPLRGNSCLIIRTHLTKMSFKLLDKCLPNVQPFAKFLLENLIYAYEDEDVKLRDFSRNSLQKLRNTKSNINQEISDLFASHLVAMPRLILMGLESEQITGLSLLHSFILLDDSLIENAFILEKFINILLSCCEMDISNDLVLFETSDLDNNLSDDFYQLKKPWKIFKNFKSDLAQRKFSEICKTIGNSRSSHVCLNYILDHISSLDHLVLIIEILSCENTTLEKEDIANVIEEFLIENYWRMDIELPKVDKRSISREEWFKDDITMVEMKLTDIKFEVDDERHKELNLKTIRYNILCTCFVNELIGSAALQLGKSFQPFILRSLHRVLEKAGNSNFLIRSAGLYSINSITKAMGFEKPQQLINAHSDFLLFNIQNLLKRNYENESFLDMMSVIFKFSRTSIASYVEDIIETAASHLASKDNSCAFLKLFNLYALSVKRDDFENCNEIDFDDGPMRELNDWKNFISECVFELNNVKEEVEEVVQTDNDNSGNYNEDDNKPPPPLHTKLILQILNSSLPFFASSNPSEVILTHEIFKNSIPILHKHDDTNFLPIIHQMWYPFTKQFQGTNFVVLHHSFRMLKLITNLAKDFVYHKSTDNVLPVINKFLLSSIDHQNASYSQEFKLQREILSGYGQLLIDIGVDDEELDKIINILLKYLNHQNSQLNSPCKKSIEAISRYDPLLVIYKFQKI